MKATVRNVTLSLLLFSGFLFPAALPGAAAGDAPYRAAIEDAERDLERLAEDPPSAPSGFGLPEILGIVALLAALGFMAYALRWTRGGFASKRLSRDMQLLDRMATGRNTTLLLVRVRGRDYWLADNPGGITLLAEFTPDGTVSSEYDKKESSISQKPSM